MLKFLVERPQTLYNSLMEEIHKPVLLTEVLKYLNPQRGESYLDLTAGYAGHANCILEVTRNYKDSVLIDRDAFAIEYLREKYAKEALEIVNQDFYSSALQLIECGKTFDMILGDFGVSSLQLDKTERGFSFSKDAVLDMRMDRSQKMTAADVVNKYSEKKLEKILVEYGEESVGRAKMLAREIVHGRPWQGTVELSEMILKHSPRGKTHPATKVFQAIRIEVNNELEIIKNTLPLLPKLLNPGGRVALISFHSLEDRLVKDYFRQASSYGEESELKIITNAPIVAEANELVINPRARSAKLRVAQRI